MSKIYFSFFILFFSFTFCFSQIDKGSLEVDGALSLSIASDGGVAFSLEPSFVYFFSPRFGLGGQLIFSLGDGSLIVGNRLWVRGNLMLKDQLVLFANLGWSRQEVFRDSGTRFFLFSETNGIFLGSGLQYFLTPMATIKGTIDYPFLNFISIIGSQERVFAFPLRFSVGLNLMLHKDQDQFLHLSFPVKTFFEKGNKQLGGTVEIIGDGSLDAQPFYQYFVLNRLSVGGALGINISGGYNFVSLQLGPSVRYHLPIGKRKALIFGAALLPELLFRRIGNTEFVSIWNYELNPEVVFGQFVAPNILLETYVSYPLTYLPITKRITDEGIQAGVRLAFYLRTQ